MGEFDRSGLVHKMAAANKRLDEYGIIMESFAKVQTDHSKTIHALREEQGAHRMTITEHKLAIEDLNARLELLTITFEDLRREYIRRQYLPWYSKFANLFRKG